MADNAYINFGKDVPFGESLNETHNGRKGWTGIGELSLEIIAEPDTKGTGMSAGKAQAGELSFTHSFDSASPAMLSKMVAGKHFDVVTIEMLKTTGDLEVPGVFFQIKLAYAFVTSITTKGVDGTLTQDVEMVFKEIYVGYKPQSNLGGLGPTVSLDWSLTTGGIGTGITGKL